MIATLSIKTELKGARTLLKTAYTTTPFKLANITEDKKAGDLHLMLMSSSPGILNGDHYQMKIELGEGCVLHLHTQSYQRLFNMEQSASQSLEVHLAPNCSFHFLPHPSVPHKLSSFVTHTKIHLSSHCRLVFGEILTCGRKLNGEVFSFSKYHSLTEVFVNNKMVIKENLLVQPAENNPGAIGQLEGFTHQASLIYLCEGANIKDQSKAIQALLDTEKEVIFGISETLVNGLIIRLLGQKGEQLYNCLQAIGQILSQGSHFKPLEYAQ